MHVALHELVQYDLALTAAAVSVVGVSPPGAQQQKLGLRQSDTGCIWQGRDGNLTGHTPEGRPRLYEGGGFVSESCP